MKTNKYVTFEQAKLLKELGFPQLIVDEYCGYVHHRLFTNCAYYSLEDMEYQDCHRFRDYHVENMKRGDLLYPDTSPQKIIGWRTHKDGYKEEILEKDELFHTHIALAPTLHEAADWLREKGLYTYPKLNALNKWYAVVHFLEYAETVRQEEMYDDFNTALSHGIDYCLSALKYKEK